MYESNCLANKMSGINYKHYEDSDIVIALLVGREIAANVGNGRNTRCNQMIFFFLCTTVFYNAQCCPKLCAFGCW